MKPDWPTGKTRKKYRIYYIIRLSSYSNIKAMNPLGRMCWFFLLLALMVKTNRNAEVYLIHLSWHVNRFFEILFGDITVHIKSLRKFSLFCKTSKPSLPPLATTTVSYSKLHLILDTPWFSIFYPSSAPFLPLPVFHYPSRHR